MSIKRKAEDALFAAIDPLLPDLETFYIISDDTMSEVRNRVAKQMEDNRDAFDVDIGENGVEWSVNDYEKAEEHLKAKAAWDALDLLISMSHKTSQPSNFPEKEGSKTMKDFEFHDNMWT